MTSTTPHRFVQGCPQLGPREQGLTLLEVLVAMVILSLAIGTLFSGLGGVSRLSTVASQHEVAMRLAQSKLDEYLRQAGDTLAPEPDDLVYGGVKYGFRITSSLHAPAPSSSEVAPSAPRDPAGPAVLKKVNIEVFWGIQPNLRRFHLTTYRRLKAAG